MLDAEMFRHKLMLCSNVVVKGDIRERLSCWVIRWGGGLAVAEEGGNDDEVLYISMPVFNDDLDISRLLDLGFCQLQSARHYPQ